MHTFGRPRCIICGGELTFEKKGYHEYCKRRLRGKARLEFMQRLLGTKHVLSELSGV